MRNTDTTLSRISTKFRSVSFDVDGLRQRASVFDEFPKASTEDHITISGLHVPPNCDSRGFQDLQCRVQSFLFDETFQYGDRDLRAIAESTLLFQRHVTFEPRIDGDLGTENRVDLGNLERLLYHRDIRLEGTEMCFCYRDANSEGHPFKYKITLLGLRRHLFMYLTHILDTAPPYVMPEMPAVWVDMRCNILVKDGAAFPPPANETWTRFIDDPSSLYNKMKERMARKRKYMGLDCHVECHWYRLEDVLFNAKEPEST